MSSTIGRGTIATITQVANFTGWSTRQLRDYVASGAPVVSKGGPGKPTTVQTFLFFRWWADRIRTETHGEKSPVDEAKQRTANAAAELKELQLEREREKFVRAADLDKLIDYSFVDARVMLMQAAKETGSREIEIMVENVLGITVAKAKELAAELEVV